MLIKKAVDMRNEIERYEVILGGRSLLIIFFNLNFFFDFFTKSSFILINNNLNPNSTVAAIYAYSQALKTLPKKENIQASLVIL